MSRIKDRQCPPPNYSYEVPKAPREYGRNRWQQFFIKYKTVVIVSSLLLLFLLSILTYG